MASIPDLTRYIEQATAVELPAPTPRAGATEGDPHESAMQLYVDDQIEIGVWECSAGRFPGARAGYSESMVVVRGSGTLTSEGGDSVELAPGSVYVSLDGWKGEWNLREPLRKVYWIWGRTGA